MIKKQILKISGMHCVSCAMNIDGELEDTPGVLNASTNYAKQVTEVEYDTEKVSESNIQEIIKKTGYQILK